jgi:MSHA biogenesis protein MshJ
VKHYWELAQAKVEAMPLRERLIVFVAIAFAVVALTTTMLLNPLLKKQQDLTKKLTQQQNQMKELQAKVQEISQARQAGEHSPLRAKAAELNVQIIAKKEYIQNLREHLVEPDKIAAMLEQILNKNNRLQLVSLETLPVDLVMDANKKNHAGQKQIFKHGVKITLRGGYLDLLQYLDAVEKATVKMYWGDVNFSVDKYPDGILILTLYTLSLEKVWLKV